MKQGFFQSPFFLSITVGIPFCIYKILFGLLAIREGNENASSVLIVAGWLVICWAALDLAMNLVRAGTDLAGSDHVREYCTLAEFGAIFSAQTVFLALDTLITFSIICFVLWSGWIIHLTMYESFLWYFATTLNLISLSLVTLWSEMIRRREQNRKTRTGE